jgi:hypothetical protein
VDVQVSEVTPGLHVPEAACGTWHMPLTCSCKDSYLLRLYVSTGAPACCLLQQCSVLL